jgi:hypothetical protein
MGFAIINSQNKYAGSWSRYDNPPRALQSGESVVECDWDVDNNRPVGVTMPEPPTVPNWRSFRASLVMSSAYGRITGHNNQTLAILPVLVNVAFLLDSDALRAVEFAGLWNAIATIAEPTTEEITALNSIAATNNVPFQLNSEGLIQ